MSYFTELQRPLQVNYKEGVQMKKIVSNSKSFTYNLERLKGCVESKTVTKPKGLRGNDLTQWLMAH